MELESEDGSKVPIAFDGEVNIGRESGLRFGRSAADRTVSRRHLALRLMDDPIEKFRIGFEVIGKNPICVCGAGNGGRRIYKNLEKGELSAGDRLSLSLKNPSVWVVKRRGEENEEDEEQRRVLAAVERRERRTLQRIREKEERPNEEVSEGEDDGLIVSLDVSQIDPVKEFGFVVQGHEFDQYRKKKTLDPRKWNWFLEEAGDSSDDDETIDEAASSGTKKCRMRKKKSGKDSDDDEWTGESEEEKVVVEKGGSSKRPKYSTRSKDMKRQRKNATAVRNPAGKKGAKALKDEVEEEDEDDPTLGGFIVDEEEEEEFENEESEEEFDDEEEDEEE